MTSQDIASQFTVNEVVLRELAHLLGVSEEHFADRLEVISFTCSIFARVVVIEERLCAMSVEIQTCLGGLPG